MRATTSIATSIAIAIAAAVGLSACSSSPSLTADDKARCQTVSELSSSDDGGNWNSTFIDLANADNPALRDVGKAFVDAPLSDVGEGKPYQKRALAVCGDGGFKAKPRG